MVDPIRLIWENQHFAIHFALLRGEEDLIGPRIRCGLAEGSLFASINLELGKKSIIVTLYGVWWDNFYKN